MPHVSSLLCLCVVGGMFGPFVPDTLPRLACRKREGNRGREMRVRRIPHALHRLLSPHSLSNDEMMHVVFSRGPCVLSCSRIRVPDFLLALSSWSCNTNNTSLSLSLLSFPPVLQPGSRKAVYMCMCMSAAASAAYSAPKCKPGMHSFAPSSRPLSSIVCCLTCPAHATATCCSCQTPPPFSLHPCFPLSPALSHSRQEFG